MCNTRWPSVYHQWYTVLCILPSENNVPEYQNLQTHHCENNKNLKLILPLSRTVLTYLKTCIQKAAYLNCSIYISYFDWDLFVACFNISLPMLP